MQFCVLSETPLFEDCLTPQSKFWICWTFWNRRADCTVQNKRQSNGENTVRDFSSNPYDDLQCRIWKMKRNKKSSHKPPCPENCTFIPMRYSNELHWLTLFLFLYKCMVSSGCIFFQKSTQFFSFLFLMCYKPFFVQTKLSEFVWCVH